MTQVFRHRYDLHKTVYSHRVAKAVELMISDMLTLSDAELDISGCVQTAEKFIRLDDTVLKQIGPFAAVFFRVTCHVSL